jgi:hypothetical protein
MRTQRELDRIPLSAEAAKIGKTPRYPAKDEGGNYVGSIGQQYALSEVERERVRKVLAEAEGTMLLSQLADQVDMKLKFCGPRLSSLERYLAELEPVEVEKVFEERGPTVTGRARGGRAFKGYRGTAKLKELVKKGLR